MLLVFKAELGIAEHNEAGHDDTQNTYPHQGFNKAIKNGVLCHKIKLTYEREQHPYTANQ